MTLKGRLKTTFPAGFPKGSIVSVQQIDGDQALIMNKYCKKMWVNMKHLENPNK